MPPIQEAPRALDFIVSEANGWRSREKAVLSQQIDAVVLMPGTLLIPEADYTDPANPVNFTGNHIPATALLVDFTNAILCYPADTRAGDVEAAVIIRDAEVNSAYLLYNESTVAGLPIPPDQANAALSNNGIIVRAGVLAQSLVAPPIDPNA
jgi:head decoration protein D